MTLFVHLEVAGRPKVAVDANQAERIQSTGYARWRIENLAALATIAALAREQNAPIETAIDGLVDVEWRKISYPLCRDTTRLVVDCDGRLTLYARSGGKRWPGLLDIWTRQTTLAELQAAEKRLDRNVFVPLPGKSQASFANEVFEDCGIQLSRDDESLSESPTP
jgi:hypothetical protein